MKLVDFFRRQTRNFKVIVAKNSFDSTRQTMEDYTSLYVRVLGADPLILGLVYGFQRIANAIISIPAGWFSDKYSVKRVMLFGVSLAVVSSLICAEAKIFWMVIPAMLFFTASFTLSRLTANVVLANSLETSERTTGMGIYSAISFVPAIFFPMVAGYIVQHFGGISREGIRPLFYFQIIISVSAFFLVATCLVDFIGGGRRKLSLVKDFREVFEAGEGLKRFLFLDCVRLFFLTMTTTFRPLYSVESKGADPIVLGAMATSANVLSVLCFIPAGRLADSIGRKKTIYLLLPFAYASNLLLIFSPASHFLVASGALQAGQLILTETAWRSFFMELVPSELRGRWVGVVFLTVRVVSIPAPIVGGFLWQNFNPAVIFILPIVFDVVFVIPLLASLPETLKSTRHKAVMLTDKSAC